MNYTIFEKSYKVNSLSINPSKKLRLVRLLEILQDIADDHAEHLGFGYEDLQEKGFFWVLVRQKLQMREYPSLNQTIRVQTWSRPIVGAYAVRDFEIFAGDEKIGDCSSTWMILDLQTKRPKKIKNLDSLFNVRTDYAVDYSAQKVATPEQMQAVKQFEVRISDLDMNNHVNNIKYTQWILDSIPFAAYQRNMTKEYEINFSGETFLGDEVEISRNLQNADDAEVYFKINKIQDGKTVCSVKLVREEVK